MAKITVEVPDEVAAQLDPETLPAMLRDLIARKTARQKSGSGDHRPIYREITEIFGGGPTAEQIVAFKISAAAQERLEDLLYKRSEQALSPDENAEWKRIYSSANGARF